MLAPSKSDFTGGGDGVDDWRDRRLHFVGVGGCGMSGLTLVARSLGATVSGSDCADQPVLARLRAAGVSTDVGHAADQVPAGVELIYSTAILPDNPERRRAEELGLPVRRRGELLAELSASFSLRRSTTSSGIGPSFWPFPGGQILGGSTRPIRAWLPRAHGSTGESTR